MSAATTRTASTAPDLRQVGFAMAALIFAVALLVAVAISRPASLGVATPANAPATVHDHGASTDINAQAPVLVIEGADGGGLIYTGIPKQAPATVDNAGGASPREHFAR